MLKLARALHEEFKANPFSLFKFFAAIICVYTLWDGAFSGDWEQFQTCAPFAILLIPGYLELLPRGGMKHWSTTAEHDEFAFWGELGTRGLLVLPPILGSIFMYEFLEGGLQQAARETLLATALTAFYCTLCIVAFHKLARKGQDQE